LEEGDDWRTWQILPATIGGTGARAKKKYQDCTRETLVWIEMIGSPNRIRAIGKSEDYGYQESRFKNMFKSKTWLRDSGELEEPHRRACLGCRPEDAQVPSWSGFLAYEQ
jgi:hypothetical protein